MPLDETQARLIDSALLDAVTDAIVALHLHYHHRVPTTARTQLLGADVLACTLGGISCADVPGDPDEVRDAAAAREDQIRYQKTARSACIELVERLTGRRVQAYTSQLHVGPDLVVELFKLAPKADGRFARPHPDARDSG